MSQEDVKFNPVEVFSHTQLGTLGSREFLVSPEKNQCDSVPEGLSTPGLSLYLNDF